MAPRPHHHHALTKASAKHLHKHGHIDTEQRDKIFKSADRGMKAAAKARAATMPQQPQPRMAPPRSVSGPLGGMGGMGGMGAALGGGEPDGDEF